MRKLKWIVLLCLVLAICLYVASRRTSADKGAETIVGWLIDRIADGEVDMSEEDSIRKALSEGESELSLTLTQEEEDRIVAFVKSLDSIETGAGDFVEQAKASYQKYSVELAEQANDAINGAVEGAVKGAVDSFFQNIRQTVADFFSNLF